MKELKAWKLTIESKENNRRTGIYHVAETKEKAKEYFHENFSRFQNLLDIKDVSNTTRGDFLIGKNVSRFS